MQHRVWNAADSVNRYLGVVPARGGSVGLPGKNLMHIGGKSLLEWAGRALLESEVCDLSVCSTDSAEIARCASDFGLIVPGLRPESLAADTALVVDTLKHLLSLLAARGETFSHVVLTQPTSPSVTPLDIRGAVELLERTGADSIVSAARTPKNFHPGAQFLQTPSGAVTPALPDALQDRRQELPEAWFRAGLVYVFSAHDILENNSLYGSHIELFEVDFERVHLIDDREDFERAVKYFERANQSHERPIDV